METQEFAARTSLVPRQDVSLSLLENCVIKNVLMSRLTLALRSPNVTEVIIIITKSQ